MENISNKTTPVRARDIFYFRQRLKNRVFNKIVAFFAEESESKGTTKRDIAARLNRDPAQITRWLSSPSNMTLDTISDILLSMGAEPVDPTFVRFTERATPNYAHPLIATLAMKDGNEPRKIPKPLTIIIEVNKKDSMNATIFIGDPKQRSYRMLQTSGETKRAATVDAVT